MKRIVCFILTFAMLLCLSVSASAVKVGDNSFNIYTFNLNSPSFGDYINYLKTLRNARGTVYSTEELSEIYNQVSFFMVNKYSIETTDKNLQNLIDSIMMVGIRPDEECNCVEVVIHGLNSEKEQLFCEYICDSDAVVLWDNYQLSAPSSDYVDVSVDLRPTEPTSIKLKAGQTKSIPAANKDKVQLWRTSSKAAAVSGGTVTACKKGSADITAVYSSAVELTFHCDVTTNPTLKYGDKKVSSISLKKGKTKSLKLSGKAASINNKYTSAKKAKITSKPSAKTIKIKGLKKGKAKVKIKVNNSYTFTVTVNVK